MTQDLEAKIQAVETYFKKNFSLRKTSNIFKIPHQYIHRWARWYKESGKENLEKKLLAYKKPWNRASAKKEEKVALLKEQDPSITVRKAKTLLDRKGIRMSLKGIWEIWRRYGYAGFKKENMDADFRNYTSFTKEAEKKLKQAEKLFLAGKIKETAYILNSIPSLPKNELLSKIPDRYLNERRRTEKIAGLFGKIPLRTYFLKTKLYKECKKQNLNYLALRVGIREVMALEWRGKPEKGLKKIEELKKIINKTQNYSSYLLFEPKFTLFISEGIFCAALLKIKRAEEIAETCKRLLKKQKQVSPYLISDLGGLYMRIENYKEAEHWLLKALNKVDEKTSKRLKTILARIFLIKGEYKKAISFSMHGGLAELPQHPWKLYFDSVLFLIKGMPQKTISLSLDALSLARKEELNIGIFNISFTRASAYASLGEKGKARKILLNSIPFLEKHKLKREKSTIEVLVNKAVGARHAVPLPTIKLAYLLKNKNYYKALSYAKKKYLLTYFYMYLFFFPVSAINLIERGKKAELPRSILKLPVFNKDIPIYNIKFLGDLIVEKNEEYLRPNLKPKDEAFLIHLALRAEAPGKELSLESLYENFWKDKSNPRSNLSHMLLRIKKALKIPSHLLEISHTEGVLRNKGIYWTTDYLEYEQALANARAFLIGGEWKFANKEFLTAINLMRGEPFEKMYDNWSDEKRLAILNQYENEVKKFAEECTSHKRQKLAEKVLKKAERVLNVKLQSSSA